MIFLRGNNIPKIIYPGILFIFLSFKALPQVNISGTPFITNYSRIDYQAGLQNWMIDQGNDGRIYFANNDGLLEFDGINWNIHQLSKGVIARSVFAAEDGKIYVGGYNEFGYFQADSMGKLIYHSLIHLLSPEDRNFDEIWRIHNTPDGLVFQSFKQLIILDKEKIVIVKAPGIFHLSYFVNGQLLIVDKEKGLLRYTMGNFFPLIGTGKLTGIEIWAILPWGSNLLFATAEQGIYIYDGNQLEEWSNQSAEYLKRNQVYYASDLDDDHLAFGTIQNGLLICSKDGTPLQKINKIKGLQNNTILCIFKDIDGNLWLGTDNGIDYVEINSPLSVLSYADGVSAGYAASRFKDILYLGTNQGVFYKSWESFLSPDLDEEFKLIDKTQGQVWTLQVIDDQLFCGTHRGIYIIGGTEANKIADLPGGWTFKQLPGQSNRIIAGTYTGLAMLKKNNGQWNEITKIKGFNESSRFFELDEDESIWISHGFKGVFHLQLNVSKDSVQKVDFYNSQQGFKNDIGINVVRLKGEILFSCNDGLYKYNKDRDLFERSDFINDIIKWKNLSRLREDDQGNIWYFANAECGVLRLREDGGYTNINLPFKAIRGNFIGGFEFVYPINQQNVLFGSSNGFIHYNPEKLKNYQDPFKVFIHKVSNLYPDSIIYFGHGSIENQSKPELDFRNNRLQFDFSANDYENPTRIKFSSYLEGFDSKWSDWDLRNNREFTNLHEGDYTLYVKAMNIYGIETEAATFSFRINPPWERTLTAYILYTIFGIILFFVILLLIRRKIERSKRKEKYLQQEKFREKEEKLQRETLEAEKEIIRLRNEKLREQMITKDKELANSTMDMIKKNKLLNRIKSDLKNISSSTTDQDLKNQIQVLSKKINKELDTEKQWEVFETHFENVHEAFLKRLKNEYPNLSPRELKLCAYLRLNISSKEIAALMNISTRGVEISRYRLRKKLALERNENLTDFILSF